MCIIVYIVVTLVIVDGLSRVNKIIINNHETSINILHTRYIASHHLQLGNRMDNFTDLSKVVICSSDIDSETLEAIWIVSSLTATAALTAIVGLVRSWRRRRRIPREETKLE